MKRIVCIINSTGMPMQNAERVAHLVRELSQVEGVTVVNQHETADQPHTQGLAGFLDHIDPHHKMILRRVISLGIMSSRMFDLPDIKLVAASPKQTANYQFPGASRQHTVRARQEIKRFSLNPRVMKKQRKLRYRF